MSFSERIQADLVAAMKSKDSVRVGVLRMVKAALKNKEIELRKALEPEEEIQVLQALVKQRNESIDVFSRAGRDDLASKETAERDIIVAYLPEAVSPGEIEKVVGDVVAELGASSPKDVGAVMKEALSRLKATGKTVDGKAVNAAVRAKLS
jgi:uncharacterized protein YqeY